MDYLDHKSETYRLVAGIHMNRERRVTQQMAHVLIRPGLFLNDTPVSLKLLEEPRLRVTSVDHSDVPTSIEISNFPLFEDRESIHDIRVPPRLRSLTVTLSAKVKNLSSGKTVDLTATHTFALNEIERTDKIEDVHLVRFANGYAVELLGRSGEAKVDRPVQETIKHRDFKEPVSIILKTDARGRVWFGPLVDITTITAQGPDGPAHTWRLPDEAHT